MTHSGLLRPGGGGWGAGRNSNGQWCWQNNYQQTTSGAAGLWKGGRGQFETPAAGQGWRMMSLDSVHHGGTLALLSLAFSKTPDYGGAAPGLSHRLPTEKAGMEGMALGEQLAFVLQYLEATTSSSEPHLSMVPAKAPPGGACLGLFRAFRAGLSSQEESLLFALSSQGPVAQLQGCMCGGCMHRLCQQRKRVL